MTMNLRQGIRFLFSGVLNTAIGLSLIYTGMFLGLSDEMANVIGYAIGITASFLVNRNWTFEHRGRVVPAATRFAVSVLAAYLINLGTMLVIRDRLGLNPWLSQALAVIPYAIVLYLLSIYFVFHKRQ